MTDHTAGDITNERQMAQDIEGSLESLSLYIAILMLSTRQMPGPVQDFRSTKQFRSMIELVFGAYAAGHSRGYVRGYEDGQDIER
jgi:hypothetical protein